MYISCLHADQFSSLSHVASCGHTMNYLTNKWIVFEKLTFSCMWNGLTTDLVNPELVVVKPLFIRDLRFCDFCRWCFAQQQDVVWYRETTEDSVFSSALVPLIPGMYTYK